MNKRTTSLLIKIANTLDSSGYYKEADKVTQTMVKISQNFKELKDLTQEDLIESDRNFAERSKEVAIEKEQRRVGKYYKNLENVKEALRYFFEKWRGRHYIRQGKSFNLFRKMMDKKMIDGLVDKFYELFATKTRKDVERAFNEFLKSNRDEFWVDDSEIQSFIIVPFYHTQEEIDKNRDLTTYRPFTFEED